MRLFRKKKRKYKYLISYSFRTDNDNGNGRMIIELDSKIASEDDIIDVEIKIEDYIDIEYVYDISLMSFSLIEE